MTNNFPPNADTSSDLPAPSRWPAWLRHPLLFRFFDAARAGLRDIREQRRFTDRSMPETADRVLLIRDRGLGDVLQISTLFERIRRRYSARRLDLMTSAQAASVFKADERIDKILTTDAPPEKFAADYDLIFNLHLADHSPAAKRAVLAVPPGKLAGRTYAPGIDEEWYKYPAGGCWLRRYCRITDVPFEPDLPLRIRIPRSGNWAAEGEAFHRRHLPADRPLTGLCLGGADWHRNYSVDFLGRLIDALSADAPVALIGIKTDRTPAERATLERLLAARPGVTDLTVDVPRDETLREMFYTIEACNVLVTCDTGPLHMAIGLDTPVVALFGHTDGRQIMGPIRQTPRFILLTPPGLCRFCRYRVRPSCRREERADCMDRFDPRTVREAARRLAASGAGKTP